MNTPARSTDPIDAWCSRTGKHQSDLAKKAEITEAALSYFRHGRRGLSATALFRLAKAMGVSAERLLQWNTGARAKKSAVRP